MPVTIIMRKGHRKGPEAVIEDLKHMKQAHGEISNDRERELAKKERSRRMDYEDRREVCHKHRARMKRLREEAAERLDEYDW